MPSSRGILKSVMTVCDVLVLLDEAERLVAVGGASITS